jgi:uncharacterized protein (TIGR02270 family)
MTAAAPPIIADIVVQHIDEAASLRATRSTLVRAASVRLRELARADERLRAHVDGLRVAGDDGHRLALAALDPASPSALFVAALCAIERHDLALVRRLIDDAPLTPGGEKALVSAFGWVSAASLRGLIAELLGAQAPAARRIGVAACALHRVNPGAMLGPALSDADAALRARALRAAGELGRTELLAACIERAVHDPDPACRFQAAWSARLLGDRTQADDVLQAFARQPGPLRHEALQLALLGAEPDRARELVRQLADNSADLRTTIRATGWAGGLPAAAWLIRQMESSQTARLAGEAFSLLSGADLAQEGLECTPSPAPAADNDAQADAADDETADDDVALDHDEGLPRPDPAKVLAWWESHRAQLPVHGRSFMGAAPDDASCRRALAGATQRQRRCAALLLSVMHPGRVLFNIAAPAWRQQRLLAQMSGS